MPLRLCPFGLLSLLAGGLNAQSIINGQIFTPGIAIIDAPQPNAPLGGGMISTPLQTLSTR